MQGGSTETDRKPEVTAPAADVLPNQVGLFAVAVSLLVALQVVGHALIAVLDRRTEPDERDRLSGLRDAALAVSARWVSHGQG